MKMKKMEDVDMKMWKKTTAIALATGLCLSATVQVFAEKTSKSEETPTQTVSIVAEENKKENVEDTIIEDTKVKKEQTQEEKTDKKESVKQEKEKTTSTKKLNTTKKETKTIKKETKTTKKKNTTKVVKKENNKVKLGTFKVYAYSSGGITASGARTKANHTVAVDPKVIPLGSKIMVNGKIYKAEDTGGAIKGNKLDIYMPSESACRNWGVRNCTVYLLK